MLFKSLAVGLALSASQAAAFLVVPLSQADADVVDALPLDAAGPATTRLLKLSCPGCPVQLKSHHHQHRPDGVRTKNDIPNHLELTFGIDSDSSDVDRLLLNGYELYPKSAAWYSVLRAPQIIDFTDLLMKHPPVSRPDTPHLGYSLSIRPVAKEDDGQQLELFDVDFQILEVGNSFVDGIPNVNLKLIKTPAGKLMMAGLETTDSETIQTTPMEKQEDCAGFYCKWRAAVADKIKGFRNCANKSKGQGRVHGHGQMHGHHRPSPYQQHHHTWGRLFKNITSGILLPVLIGLVAGVSLSIIGMLVGTFFICLWRVFVRRQSPFSRRHRCRHDRCRKAVAAERRAAVVEEKSSLMADQDVADLPPYRDEVEDDVREA